MATRTGSRGRLDVSEVDVIGQAGRGVGVVGIYSWIKHHTKRVTESLGTRLGTARWHVARKIKTTHPFCQLETHS